MICRRLAINLQVSSTMINYQDKTERFFKTVEAGDIALFNLFGDAIAVLGFTKAGKTSSCHILVNSPLKAELYNGDLIYNSTTNKYRSAVIGNTNESETEIPNIFETKFRNSSGSLTPVTLLDQPGYGDGYGFHRIFSNGYFHYRTFSKTPRLKFILAFKKTDLEGTAEKFKNSIQNFINTFSNYDNIKEKILNATVFLVTQADPKNNLEHIRSIIEKLGNTETSSFTEAERRNYQEMVSHMLAKGKIFVIEKPEQANNQTKESDLLRKISEKTTFWERKVYTNVVDMSDINFSVAFEVLGPLTSHKGHESFKQEFLFFKNQMNKRIMEILQSHQFALKPIIDILMEDAVGRIDSHAFLEGMQRFIQTFYKFNEGYKERREKTECELFALKDLADMEDSRLGLLNTNEVKIGEQNDREKQMKSMFFIKKFKVLEYIVTRSLQIPSIPHDRNVGWLQSISLFFIDMFRKFNLLRVKRCDSERIIYKYSYIVQRLIEQSKIMTLILFSNQKARKKFDEIENAMIDIFRPLNDYIFTRFQGIDVPLLKEEFVKQLDFDSLQVVNKEIVEFFESVPQFDQGIVYKIANLVLRFADLVKDKKNKASFEEKKFVTSKLFQYRNKFYSYLQNLEKEKSPNREEREASIGLIIRLSRELGHQLLAIPSYALARGVFKCISSPELVFQVFETELKTLEPSRKSNAQAIKNLLLEYGQYAAYCHRRELALKCYQQAETLSTLFKEFQKISELIVALETIKPQDSPDPYLKRLNNKKFCEEFPEVLKVQIRIVCQSIPPSI